jgi:hypothetical protein
VDSTGKYWLINACSCDFLDFMPLDDYEESPNKNRYISEMKKMQHPLPVHTISDYERKKKCGFCELYWAESEVQSVLTAKVLLDTYNWLSMTNHDTSFLNPPKLDTSSLDYF